MMATLATETLDFNPSASTRLLSQRTLGERHRRLGDRAVADVLRDETHSQESAETTVVQTNGSGRRQTWLPQDAAKVINIPQAFRAVNYRNRAINTLQEWEGIVDNVGRDGFQARLRDLTDRTRAPEFAWIPLDEVDPKDHDRLKSGAVFHLIVGFCRRGGGRKRETELYFRRHLPSAKSVTGELADLLDFFGDYDG